MFRKSLVVMTCLFLVGCATITVPKYIKDENPYTEKYLADFATTQKVVISTLEKLGWKIEDTADPMVYERGQKYASVEDKQVLLFTEVKQTPFFIGTKYKRINVYLRALDAATTEVELRFIVINQFPLKSFYGYKKSGYAQKIFKMITKKLG